MAYNLSWYITDRVLFVTLDSHSTIGELQKLNKEITDVLYGCENKIHIVFDASKLEPDYNTSSQLRETQQYIYNPNLAGIIVIVQNKLTRLITLVAFCLARAHFTQVDNFEKATAYMKLRGIS